MTSEQRTMIVTGVKDGADARRIADTTGIPLVDVQIFISWWRDRGCPDLTF